MAIARNETALSSEIAAKLKATNEKPYCYLSGQAFTSDFASLENSSQIYIDAVQQPNQSITKKIFQSSGTAQNDFIDNVDVGKGTPKQLIDLANDGSIPIASFDDLSTFVVNAFLEQTNVRYSKFVLLRSAGNGYKERYEVNKHALLTDKAILGTNATVAPFPSYYLNNQISSSQTILSSPELFFSKLTDADKNNIANLRPKNNNGSSLTSGLLSASIVSAMINAVNTGTKRIANNLSCLFSEFDLNAECEITYHPSELENPPRNPITVSVPYYTAYTIISYSDVFQGTSVIAQNAWSTKKENGPMDPRYTSGTTIYPDISKIDLYPIVNKNVKFFVPSNSQYVIAKSQSEVNSVQRPDYVKTRNRLDDFSVEESVQIFTPNFKLPSCDDYFKVNGNLAVFSFLGWKQRVPPTGSTANVDYPSSSGTDLTIDRDYAFEAKYFASDIPSIPPPYDEKTVDIRIRNNYNALAAYATQQQPFSIIIPLDGACYKPQNPSSYGWPGNGEYSLIQGDSTVIGVNSLGLSLNAKAKEQNIAIKRIKVNVAVTGNTQHTGYYTIAAYNSKNERIGISNGGNPIKFYPAETAANQDNFGWPSSPWDFKAGSYASYDFTFDFDNAANTNELSSCFLVVYGYTGYSTDDKSGYYPYRCRFCLTVTEATVGHVF